VIRDDSIRKRLSQTEQKFLLLLETSLSASDLFIVNVEGLLRFAIELRLWSLTSKVLRACYGAQLQSSKIPKLSEKSSQIAIGCAPLAVLRDLVKASCLGLPLIRVVTRILDRLRRERQLDLAAAAAQDNPYSQFFKDLDLSDLEQTRENESDDENFLVLMHLGRHGTEKEFLQWIDFLHASQPALYGGAVSAIKMSSRLVETLLKTGKIQVLRAHRSLRKSEWTSNVSMCANFFQCAVYANGDEAAIGLFKDLFTFCDPKRTAWASVAPSVVLQAIQRPTAVLVQFLAQGGYTHGVPRGEILLQALSSPLRRIPAVLRALFPDDKVSDETVPREAWQKLASQCRKNPNFTLRDLVATLAVIFKRFQREDFSTYLCPWPKDFFQLLPSLLENDALNEEEFDTALHELCQLRPLVSALLCFSKGKPYLTEQIAHLIPTSFSSIVLGIICSFHC
jgi:hypothetical protein